MYFTDKQGEPGDRAALQILRLGQYVFPGREVQKGHFISKSLSNRECTSCSQCSEFPEQISLRTPSSEVLPVSALPIHQFLYKQSAQQRSPNRRSARNARLSLHCTLLAPPLRVEFELSRHSIHPQFHKFRLFPTHFPRFHLSTPRSVQLPFHPPSPSQSIPRILLCERFAGTCRASHRRFSGRFAVRRRKTGDLR